MVASRPQSWHTKTNDHSHSHLKGLFLPCITADSCEKPWNCVFCTCGFSCSIECIMQVLGVWNVSMSGNSHMHSCKHAGFWVAQLMFAHMLKYYLPPTYNTFARWTHCRLSSCTGNISCYKPKCTFFLLFYWLPAFISRFSHVWVQWIVSMSMKSLFFVTHQAKIKMWHLPTGTLHIQYTLTHTR